MNRVQKVFKGILGGAVTFAACFMIFYGSSYAEGKATVAVNSVYIRASASTSSAVVGSGLSKDTFDVIDSEKDSAGYTWYKVKTADGVTGYVRGDLVTTEGVPAPKPEPAPETNVTLENPEVTVVVPVGGKVTGDSRVRSGASTSHSVVTTAPAKTAVTVTGYTTASDGKVWYQISYTSGSDSISGFIRSDLLKLDGELVEPAPEPEPEPEPEPAPEPEPEPTVYKDYEAVMGDDGEWYLNNYAEGTHFKVNDLYEARENMDTAKKEFESKLKKKNVFIGILLTIIILLCAGGVFAYISIRRWYYGSDSETEEPAVRKDSQSRASTREYTGSQQRTASSVTQRPSGQPSRTQTSQTQRPVTSAQPQKTSSTVQSRSSLNEKILPDGRIQMPDGSVRKAVYAVKLADGSIRYPDGRIKHPDGTIENPSAQAASNNASTVRTGASSHEVHEVSMPHTSENPDDDMEYSFLDMDTNK